MSAWPALQFEQEPTNLAGFASYLRSVGFPHRISEEGGKLIVWVFDEQYIAWVQQQYGLYQQGLLVNAPQKSSRQIPWANLKHYPLTTALVLGSVFGYLVVLLNAMQWVSWLSFQGLELVLTEQGLKLATQDHQSWLQRMQEGQWWRLFTPMFLHFSWMHLLFNITMLGYFAGQIERKNGIWFLLSSVLLMSLVSNCAQYLASDQLFGGMSGVDFGLLGFCSLVNYRQRAMVYNCPPGLFWVSLIMIAAGFLGVFSIFGMEIANWAHVGGFVSGCALALVLTSKTGKTI